MKKLLLIAIASLFGVVAYAQTQTSANGYYNTKTLNCTEEAVSLKVSILPGWHINSLHIGNVRPVKTSLELTPPNLYTTNSTVMESPPFSKFENAFNSNITYFERKTAFKPALTLKLLKAAHVPDKLNYIFWDYKEHPLPANADL
jgi:thiol:disulfide interchange protein DsbD